MSGSPAGDKPLEKYIEEELHLNLIPIERREIDKSYERENPWNHSIVWFRRRRGGSGFSSRSDFISLGGEKEDEEENPWGSMGKLRMVNVSENHTAEEVEQKNLWAKELREERDRNLARLQEREVKLREQLAELCKPEGT